jgi:prolyl-tRNA editing enzyme YbaK/EbsC (Cys-tRNA(Pro) deacylase)
MDTSLSRKANMVQDALKDAGVELKVEELSASTRTAAEAAAAVGCTVEQIAKSLIFCTANESEPILVIASGGNRVNEANLGKAIGSTLKKASADFVQEKTGYAIGGIPPVGHVQPIRTFIDQDLLQYNIIWAAAGTPHAVFRLTPQELQHITKGTVVSVL